MDRLIVKDGQDGWHLKGVPWDRLRAGQIITPDTYGRLYNALCRLAEYEGTGLTTEQIIAMIGCSRDKEVTSHDR